MQPLAMAFHSPVCLLHVFSHLEVQAKRADVDGLVGAQPEACELEPRTGERHGLLHAGNQLGPIVRVTVCIGAGATIGLRKLLKVDTAGVGEVLGLRTAPCSQTTGR